MDSANNFWPAVGAVLSGVFAIAIGYFQGRNGNSDPIVVPNVFPQSQSEAGCNAACTQLESARQASCLAAAALAAANTRISALTGQVAAAWGVSIALWAAAAAAAAIPFIGWGVAAAIAAVASAATAFALYLSGQLVAAQEDQGNKQRTADLALQTVMNARNVVLMACTGQALTDCLNRPSPCA